MRRKVINTDHAGSHLSQMKIAREKMEEDRVAKKAR
jgi:hypothetical protein